MNIITISQSIVNRVRRMNHSSNIDRRRGSDRRIHADRRKEQRFGDVVERRQQSDRRFI